VGKKQKSRKGVPVAKSQPRTLVAVAATQSAGRKWTGGTLFHPYFGVVWVKRVLSYALCSAKRMAIVPFSRTRIN